ncbi:MAG: hypothetical protein LBR64_01575 [Dysgonamonadaceae bacterium]|nr:hypothetical protein [Dysgonamonadaceae bacterium]
MKKIYSILAKSVIAITLSLFTLSVFAQSGGSGTSDNPYLIKTTDDLKAISGYGAQVGVYFKLANDIDMSGLNWQGICTTRAGAFMGVFDGDGHTISGLTYSYLAAASGYVTYPSLFGVIGSGATIKNLILEEPLINVGTGDGACYAGTLVGYIYAVGTEDVTISNILVKDAWVLSEAAGDNFAGGIVGYAIIYTGGKSKINITKCTATGNINGAFLYAGGIAGQLAAGNNAGGSITVSDCSVNADIATTRESGANFLGGIVGRPYQSAADYDPVTITRCLTQGTVDGASSADARVGGISGRLYDRGGTVNPITISSCVAANTELINAGTAARIYPSHTSGGYIVIADNLGYSEMIVKGATVSSTSATGGSGLDKTEAELKQKATYEAIGWNFTDVWAIDEGNDYPILRGVAGGDDITGIQAVAAAQTLKAVAAGGLLKISGYALGQTVTVYNAQGIPVYSRKAAGETVSVKLPAHGVYIVSAGNQKAKVVF